MRELLGEVKTIAVMQFPPVRLRAQELAEVAVGSVLRLPLPKHSEAELRVGGLLLASVLPVRMGEHRGAQLEGLNTSGIVGVS
jgi:flagellar motor switch protein FliM